MRSGDVDFEEGGRSNSHLSQEMDTTDKCNGKRAKQKRYLVLQSFCYLLFQKLGDKTYDRRLVIYDALYITKMLPNYILQLVTAEFSYISVMTMFVQEFSLCVYNFVELYSTSSALFVHKFGRSTQVHSVGCFKCCPCFGLYSDVVLSIILCTYYVCDSLLSLFH